MAGKSVMNLRELMNSHKEDEQPDTTVTDAAPDQPKTTQAEPEQTPEEPTTQAGPEEAQTQPGPEAAEQAPAATRPAKTTTARRTPRQPAQKATSGSRTPKKVPASTKSATKAEKKGQPARKRAAPAVVPPSGEDTPDQQDYSALESLDGRPGRLWDTSTGEQLPPGWAREALRRVTRDSRDSAAWRKGNPMLPEAVHQDVLTWILETATTTGEQHSVSQVLEAALEQIPDNADGCQVMLDELPEEYLAPNVIRPRGSRLRVDTIDQLSLLPLRLRVAGLNKHAGRVHTVAVIRLLDDLRGTRTDQEPDQESGS